MKYGWHMQSPTSYKKTQVCRPSQYRTHCIVFYGAWLRDGYARHKCDEAKEGVSGAAVVRQGQTRVQQSVFAVHLGISDLALHLGSYQRVHYTFGRIKRGCTTPGAERGRIKQLMSFDRNSHSKLQTVHYAMSTTLILNMSDFSDVFSTF